MTDSAVKPAKNLQPPGKPFKKGFDERRWMNGRNRVPKDKARASAILESVIWEELSRVINNPETGEDNDALRLMVRSMIRSRATQDKILDRIAGKVKEEVNIGGEGKLVIEIIKASDDKSPDSD